ncbi:hypothetical protein LCGC14_1970700, partial [marine sediment metagenome]
LTVFLEVARPPASVRIPQAFEDIPGLSYLGGAKMAQLLRAEKNATEYAMAMALRPTVTLRFPDITPRSVGQFIYLYEFVTSLCGELLNINAYDQPAVELGKQATFALMGREGYEDLAKEIKLFIDVCGLLGLLRQQGSGDLSGCHHPRDRACNGCHHEFLHLLSILVGAEPVCRILRCVVLPDFYIERFCPVSASAFTIW